MYWVIVFLPSFAFLAMSVITDALSKNDHYRTKSALGFRSTKAVKDFSSWQKAQLLVRNSSLVVGVIQFVLTILLKMLFLDSDDAFLSINAVTFFLLLGLQFLWVNRKLE